MSDFLLDGKYILLSQDMLPDGLSFITVTVALYLIGELDKEQSLPMNIIRPLTMVLTFMHPDLLAPDGRRIMIVGCKTGIP